MDAQPARLGIVGLGRWANVLTRAVRTGNPRDATVQKRRRVIDGVADAMAKDASEIFRRLSGAKAGIAEFRVAYPVP